MALESALESLKISDSLPEYLPFNPAIGGRLSESESNEAYQIVPRYLFRVISPRSQGENTEVWQRSHDAAPMNGIGTGDIFAMKGVAAAEMLYRHLRDPNPKLGDNLISWTNSHLFAVSYITYLRDNCYIDLRDIKLGVIDTTYLPQGVFLRDLELIQAFRSFDPRLDNLAQLRRRRHSYRNGFYYFGEYLSQGSLRVDGLCQFVDASTLVANGLYKLRPELEKWSKQWAERAISLREDFYSNATSATTEQELQAVISIAQLFEPRWRLPIASCLLALRPRDLDDPSILHALNPHILKWGEGKLVQDSSLVLRGISKRDVTNFAFETKVVPHDYLPEVAQVQRLVLALQVDCSASKLLNNVRYARKCVGLASHRAAEMPRSSIQPDMFPCQTAIQEARYKRVRRYINDLKYELSRLEKALPEVSDCASSFDETDVDDNVSDPDLVNGE